MKAPTPRWATRREAADYIRIGVDTLDRWLSDPRIPVNRYGAGRNIRIDLNELDAYLQANTRQSA